MAVVLLHAVLGLDELLGTYFRINLTATINWENPPHKGTGREIRLLPSLKTSRGRLCSIPPVG